MRSFPFAKSRLAALFLTALSLTALSACTMTSSYDPGRETERPAPAADIAYEIGAIATELADRAESRTPLGGARIQVGQLDAIQPRRSPYRQVTLLERDLRATEATVRHELAMALGNRVNLVGDGADLATHAIEGEFIRTAESLDLSLRLVELESDWIVATARRRIDDFVPEFYDRRLQAPPQDLPGELGRAIPSAGGPGARASDEDRARDVRDSLDALRASAGASAGKTRALQPAYPSGRAAPVVVQAPVPTEVLATRGDVPISAEPEVPSGDASSEVSAGDSSKPIAPLERVDPGAVPAGPIEFDAGPAAARLRATGALPPLDTAGPQGSKGPEGERQN